MSLVARLALNVADFLGRVSRRVEAFADGEARDIRPDTVTQQQEAADQQDDDDADDRRPQP